MIFRHIQATVSCFNFHQVGIWSSFRINIRDFLKKIFLGGQTFPNMSKIGQNRQSFSPRKFLYLKYLPVCLRRTSDTDHTGLQQQTMEHKQNTFGSPFKNTVGEKKEKKRKIVAKLFALHANTTRMVSAKLFALHANAKTKIYTLQNFTFLSLNE